ncbi:potassium/proton antiporter [uncultured Duncaniella sp.]|uniref:potassium/proton antiporter n=1 Tax=uncultured Duncaniella sp. TaxID=2768039 RepID=UPI0025A60193|nr:potassium/proton antiporter [uncultured Duncaniella sp.]
MEYLSSESVMLVGSILLIAGVLIGKSSYRIGLPILLIFLLVGMGFGTDGAGIQFSDMHTAQSIGMVALCIILFSGGMGTKISAIRPVIMPGIALSTAGVLMTAFITGGFIWLLSGMEWTNIHFAFLPSLLLAATMSSTDSASVFGILGSQKVAMRNNLRPLLELESGSNDPMAYMLTIILIETITMGSELSGWSVIWQLSLQFGIGGLMGVAMGKTTSRLIAFYRTWGNAKGAGEDPSQATAMISIMILGAVFLTFSATTALAGNGYLAVYICGILLGNERLPNHRGISKFMDGMTWLMQIVVFLMLGLLVNPHEMLDVAAVSLLIGVFMIAIGRPLSVFLSLAPFRGITLRSKLWVSWVGLRGAVPIIFATYPVVENVQGAGQIFNIVFFVTLLSLLIQGTTVICSARKLDLIDTDAAPEEDFGVELADELPTSLHTIELSERELTKGNTLREMSLPKGSLVMMVKRGGRYMVPNGTLKLVPGDRLLVIQEDVTPDSRHA